MRGFKLFLAATAAIVAPATASATVTVGFGGTTAIPSNNDFRTQLAALGLTRFAASGASLTLSENSIITFELLGSESGFNDRFQAGSLAYTEFTRLLNRFGNPIALGSDEFGSGSLAGDIVFSAVGGRTVTVGQDGFGIFLGPNARSGDQLSTFYLGYDDQLAHRDDDYDDMIIRATVTPAVPEPGTWAMMLIGFGAIGFSMRRGPRVVARMA